MRCDIQAPRGSLGSNDRRVVDLSAAAVRLGTWQFVSPRCSLASPEYTRVVQRADPVTSRFPNAVSLPYFPFRRHIHPLRPFRGSIFCE